MNKRIAIYERNYLERGLKGYFNEKTEYDLKIDVTEKRAYSILTEYNKLKRNRMFKLNYFDLKTKKSMYSFIKWFMINQDNVYRNSSRIYNELVDIACEVIRNLHN